MDHRLNVTGRVTRTPGYETEARKGWIEVADDDAHPLLALRRQGHVANLRSIFYIQLRNLPVQTQPITQLGTSAVTLKWSTALHGFVYIWLFTFIPSS